MNTRSSAIATSVYVLVTVMPRYSRSILSSILQGKPRSGERERGATLRTVCHTPVWCTVKLILLHHRRKQSLRRRFAFVPKIKMGQSSFKLRPLGGKPARSALVSDAAVALMRRLRHHNGE